MSEFTTTARMGEWETRYESERDAHLEDVGNEMAILRANVEAAVEFTDLFEEPVWPCNSNVATLLSGRMGHHVLDNEAVFEVLCDCLTSKRRNRAFREWFVNWTAGVIGQEDCTLQVDNVCVPFLLLMRSFRATPRVEQLVRCLFESRVRGGDDYGRIKSTEDTVWGAANELLDELAKDPFVAAHPPPPLRELDD